MMSNERRIRVVLQVIFMFNLNFNELYSVVYDFRTATPLRILLNVTLLMWCLSYENKDIH